MLESLSFFDQAQDRRPINDLIQVSQPARGTVISSPLTLSGRARGTYYFEGSFSVELTDAEGNQLVEAPVQATGNWMTEDWVPFETTIEFTPPARGGQGYLKFVKANASGLPQHERVYRVPVRFGE